LQKDTVVESSVADKMNIPEIIPTTPVASVAPVTSTADVMSASTMETASPVAATNAQAPTGNGPFARTQAQSVETVAPKVFVSKNPVKVCPTDPMELLQCDSCQ